MNATHKRLFWLILFSIAMGFLESAVVIYLREIYYPQGFGFPLQAMDPRIAWVEVIREAATLFMLLSVGILTGQSSNQRLASFVIAFAVWDLFYYLFLWLLVGWPESWLTWDILFLIPVPWTGPVLTPCLISVTMVLLGSALYYRHEQNQTHRLALREWIFLILGSLTVVISWTLDFFRFTSGLAMHGKALEVFTTYIPQSFNWWLFGLGELLLIAGIFFFWKRTNQEQNFKIQL